MNATETIFALALASNNNPKQHFLYASEQLAKIGQLQFSNSYLIPCRDGVGADYWNAACLLKSSLSVTDISVLLKNMEATSGRIRPSHQISLDVALIAWGGGLRTYAVQSQKIAFGARR